PVNAATVAAYVNYICPVEGAREAMESIDPELVDNELIFPTDEVLANAHVVRTLSADEETDFSDRFQTAIGN
ncbi:MAG: spermidine/putrescine ABC transporter substrate-binding protein, partial [Arthrobacter sp.]